MSAVVGSISKPRVRVGNVEPAVLALLRHLDGLVVIGTLFACEAAFGHVLPFAAGTLGLGLLAVIILSQMPGRPESRERRFASSPVSYSNVLLRWATVVAVLLLVSFAFKISALFSRKVMLTWFVVTPLTLCVAEALRARATRFLTYTSPLRYVIVGVNDAGVELAQRLPASGFSGYFDFRNPDRIGPLLDPEKFAGHCRDVADYVRSHGINTVYIALPLANVPRVAELLNALRDTTASVYFVPDVFAFDLIHGRMVEINGMPALSICETPIHGTEALTKRALDIVLAGVGLVLLAPLMLAVAVAIKVSSRGPVLFRQRRYGLNGEQISVLKFRSMTVCEDGPNVLQATREDCRVTGVGRFIRRTSLDELPQLFNVVAGSMSLVGPRPHAVAHNEKYRGLISGYMIRHKVRPGITGLAQVNGFRGETETLDKMSERVRYDLEYLRHWSPWLDLKILLRSIWVIWKDRNAY